MFKFKVTHNMYRFGVSKAFRIMYRKVPFEVHYVHFYEVPLKMKKLNQELLETYYYLQIK